MVEAVIFGLPRPFTVKMPYVNSGVYLELTKLDYNNCQAEHCAEWEQIQRQLNKRESSPGDFADKP
ncbi:Ent-copalyl diphosphate synthase, chloroplastic [Glycine soja]|nr:Ent-copalyl diphosphate synthase, chloroplastic [Glycine soja]